MTEEKRSFWEKLLSGDPQYQDEREQKVLQYMIHRVNQGAHLRDVIGEEYVRRNASQQEIDDLLEEPRLIEAAHKRMQEDFSSGELDPKPPPSSAT